MDQPAAVAAFRHLHASGCFVMPNPWDLGSAHLLEHLGFPALATTSAGLAWSLGHRDNGVSIEATLGHFRALAAGVDVPVNGDFTGGFAIEPERVADHVTLAVGTGVAGLSIEDATGSDVSPLFEFQLAVERIVAAREARDRSGTGVLLTGRTEGFIVGRPDLDETVRRLVAFADAGADCLYAPGVTQLDHIKTLVSAVAPRPLNVLVGRDFTTVAQLAELGVRRISVGGALARVAWAGVLASAREMADHGTFSGLSRAVPFAEIDGAFD
jgi:2-methylisocitrate lyase-like PEP mutase family enzyme